MLAFAVRAQQENPTEEDGNAGLQTEIATKDAITANSIAQHQVQTADDGSLESQLADQKSVIANLTAEREEKDAAISSLESIKQKQMALIIKLQEKEDEEATEIANFKSQLTNQTGINANLQSQLVNQNFVIANLTVEKEKSNAIIVSQKTKQDQQNLIIVDLQAKLTNQNAIITNLTAEREKKIATGSSTIDQYLGARLLFDVRRSPTPPVPENYGRGSITTITYDKAIINIGNCTNIRTGSFTSPINGYYYFAWTGPNDEPIQRSYDSMYSINNDMETANSYWIFYKDTAGKNLISRDMNTLKTHLVINLGEGQRLNFNALLKKSTYPKQYEKWVGYSLS